MRYWVGHMRFILFVAVILISGAGTAAEFKCKNKYPNLKSRPPLNLTAEEIKLEIDCIVDILKNVHPNLNVYIKQKTFESLAHNLKKRISPVERLESLHSRYLGLLSEICDEHTIIRLPEIEENWQYAFRGFPVSVYIADDVLYGKFPKQPQNDTGDRFEILVIKSINGITDKKIRQYMISQISVDGCSRNRDILIPDAWMHRYLSRFFKYSTSYDIHTLTKDGNFRKYDLSPAKSRTIFDLYTDPVGTLSFPIEKRGFSLVSEFQDWRYYVNEPNNTGYLYVGDFTNIDETQIKKIMRRIISDNKSKLIVDLSNNPGGRVSKSMLMNSFLIPRPHRPADYVIAKRYNIYRSKDLVWDTDDTKDIKQQLRQFKRAKRRGGLRRLQFRKKNFGNPHYRGKLFVLVSHRTGSAAVASTFVLKRHRPDMTLIGSKTHGGGKWGCFSPLSWYKLPYSHMRLYVPQTCLGREGKLADRYSRSIIPDVVVRPEALKIDEYGKTLMRFTLDYVEGIRTSRSN